MDEETIKTRTCLRDLKSSLDSRSSQCFSFKYRIAMCDCCEKEELYNLGYFNIIRKYQQKVLKDMLIFSNQNHTSRMQQTLDFRVLGIQR